MAEGRLFAPYKAVGLICDSVPLVLRRMPKHRLSVVLCAVGNVVHQYNAQTLRLISVSDSLGGDIKRLAADSLYVYAAYGSSIVALHLSRQVEHCYTENGHSSPIVVLLPFGDHLISVDTSSRLLVWDKEAETIYTEMNFDPETFQVSTLCHPATYINKVLMGSAGGQMKLLNLKTSKIVHDFSGWSSGISVMEQSPAVDVVGVGLEDGRIILHNLKFDETILEFRQDWGKVTQLDFRTDGPPSVISASAKGQIAVWDLEKRKIIGQMNDAHKASIAGLRCIQGEPVFVTSGPDNALKTWIFDMPDGLARQLAERSGHAKPPSLVKFHGTDGEMLLSAGLDSTVRLFSTWKDTKQQNLGTAGVMSRKKARANHLDPESIKLPAIVALSSETARENGWDNICCCHKKSPVVTTWTSKKQRLGAHKLMHKRFESQEKYRNSAALCCSVTSCGNFAMIGYTSGHVDTWNVQSGLFRGSFVDKATKGSETDKGRAHNNSVTGVCLDALNQTVVTGCKKGFLKFWRFKTKSLTRIVPLDSGICHLRLHKDNSLLAVVLADKSILVVDVDCKKPVRKFSQAHSEAVLDVAFSPSGHWLVTTGGEGKVKVWDLPTASLIEVIVFRKPCVAVGMSPTGEYLATCHSQKKGVYLWANKSVFSSGGVFKPLPLDYEPVEALDLPDSGSRTDVDLVDEPDLVEMEEDTDSSRLDRCQLSLDLLTLSGLPQPRWSQMLNIDVIRSRNKPTEPPKKPKAAPFFLPTVSDVRGFSFDTSATKNEDEESSRLKKNKLGLMQPLTDFGLRLQEASSGEELWSCFEQLKGYGPARIDVELRSLSPTNGGSLSLIAKFLNMINYVLKKQMDYEVAQSYLGLFVKIYREDLWSSNKRDEGESFRSELAGLLENVQGWERIDELMNSSLCMIQWIKSAVL